MKSEILTLLREQDGYISGQELCDRFGVSRTAVWKAIKQLKESGYDIEAVPNKGYHLAGQKDVLTQNEIESRMHTKWIGKEVYYKDITASTNLSKEDIDKAVHEAEQYAAEDKARKEEVDTHNAADQTVYQTEKTLNELGDKIDASEKSKIQAAVDHLKEVNKGTDVEAIKAATEEVQKAFYAVSEKLYQQAGAQQGQPQDGQTGNKPGDDGVVDADYETVD